MKNQNSKRRWIIVILLAILVMLLLWWLSSFFLGNKSSLSTEIIPDDVAMVFAIDVPQMLYESDFRDLQQTEAYSSYIQKASLENPIFAEVVKDPISAGISIDRDFFFVFDKDTTLNLEDFSVIIAPISDEKSFEKIVKSRKITTRDIISQNGFKYYEVDQLTAIAWNENNVVFGASKSFVSMIEKLDRFFSTKPSRSVMNDPQFQKVMDSESDIAFWISTSAYANDKAILERFGLNNFSRDIIEGNYITGSINFGKGEIEGDAQFQFKNELKLGFDNFFKEGVQSEHYDYFPSNDLTLLLSSSLNLPKIFYKGLNDEQLKKELTDFLKKKELSIDDLFRIFTGTISFATYNDGITNQPSIALALEIDNQDKLNKLFQIGTESDIIIPEGKNQFKLTSTGGAVKTNSAGISFPDNMMRVYLLDNYLFITSSATILESLKGGKVPIQNRIASGIRDQFNSFLVAGYSDLSQAAQSPDQKLRMDNVKFNLNKDELSFKLELKNKNEYALKEIFLSQ